MTASEEHSKLEDLIDRILSVGIADEAISLLARASKMPRVLNDAETELAAVLEDEGLLEKVDGGRWSATEAGTELARLVRPSARLGRWRR